MLPHQSYEPAEWWEAQPRQWAWNPYMQNPGQQVEAVWEVRESLGLNLQITFLASARVETTQPNSAGRVDLLVQTQPEVLMMTGPSNGSTPNNWGNGKVKNMNIDMWGVVDWGTFMDILESREEMGESERKTNGLLDTMIPTAVGGGRGEKQAHDSQMDTSRQSSAIVTPKKAKLSESVGARPKNTAQYSFGLQDIWYKDATQPKEPLHS